MNAHAFIIIINIYYHSEFLLGDASAVTRHILLREISKYHLAWDTSVFQTFVHGNSKNEIWPDTQEAAAVGELPN